MAPDTATQETTYAETRCLYIGIELAMKEWKLAIGSGGTRILRKKVPARNRAALLEAVRTGKRKLGLAETAKVRSCCEAGRDGFWVHRLLTELGIKNVVVDASSLKVEQKRRRKKTDRLDAKRLVIDLIRHWRPEEDVWRMARVPTEQEEDDRRPMRELERLKKEKGQHQTRIRSLLALQGIHCEGTLNPLLARLDQVRSWNGQLLPSHLKEEIRREAQRLRLALEQMSAIRAELKRRLKEQKTEQVAKVKKLVRARGIGDDSGWLLVTEMFGWRTFRNRREVGGSAGLEGSPHNTGQSEREQGISKGGNRRVRARMIELAWLWIRWQPDSDLTQWFNRRWAKGGARMRRIGIVGVARRLLIQLWHYVEHDVEPKNAVFSN